MTEMNIADLSAPFPPEAIHWRVGATTQDKKSGLALAYIDSRDVQRRLDDVCGVENWQNKYHDCGNGKLTCELLIKIGEDWIGKADGAGDTDVEAEKGAFSSAFKRAAVCWGIGRYLYEIDSPWVAIKQQGKSYVIANQKDPKLARALGQPLTDVQKAEEKITGSSYYEDGAERLTERSRLWSNMSMTWMEEASLEEIEEWWARPETQASLEKCTDHWKGKVKDCFAQVTQRHRGDMPLDMEYGLTP